MKPWKSLFGLNKPEHEDLTLTDQPTAENSNSATLSPIPKELFVDLLPPDSKSEPQAINSELERLAEQDLFDIGYEAGFTYHDPEICHNALDSIKARIRRAIEKELEVLTSTEDALEVHLQKLSGTDMPTIVRALEVKRKQLQQRSMKLKEERLHASGGTGYAELPTTTYADGFKRGYSTYLQLEYLTNTTHAQ
jgi:hypothetical protein